MKLCWFLGILVFSYGVFSNGVSKTLPSRPAVVNVGAIVSLNSIIGRVAKIAIDLAVKDVNSDPRVLGGTKLKVVIQDSGCSVFVGIVKESDDGCTFMVYNRWGRVGVKGQDKLHGPYMSRDSAIQEFEKKFSDKTKNCVV